MLFNTKYFKLLPAILFLSACSTNKQAIQYEPVVIQLPRQVDKLNYTVKEGDTVGSIARNHNMTRADFINLNNLTPPYELYAGQKLIVKMENDGIVTQSIKTSDNMTMSEQVEIEKFTNDLNKVNQVKVEIVQKGGLEVKNSNIKNSTTNDVINKQALDISNNLEENDQEGDETTTKEQIENNSGNSDKTIQYVPVHPNNSNQKSRYIWPIDHGKNKIVQQFGPDSEYILIESSGGTPVKSAGNGIVKFAGKAPKEENNIYGNIVLVTQNDPHRLFMYAKLQNVNVHKGDHVKIGDKLGEVAIGSNPSLYFSIMNINKQKKRTPIDPTTII